jgi:hypothetical protein
MSDADETTSSSYQANSLRISSREKYASGAERLQMGADALALLGFQGALEDGLWAYAIEQGQAPQSWADLLDLLQSDPDQPLSDKQVALINQNRQLRNQIAHGEEVDLSRSDVAAYQQITWQILRLYGVSVERRTPSRRLDRSMAETASSARSEYPTGSRSARSSYPTGSRSARSEYPTGNRSARSRYSADYDDEDEELTWQEQASDFVQQNRQFLFPLGIGILVILMSFVIYQLLVGDGPTPPPMAVDSSNQQNETDRLQTAVIDEQLQANSPDWLNNATPDPLATPLTGYSPPVLTQLTPVTGTNDLAENNAQFGNLVAGGNALVLIEVGDLNVRNQPGTGFNSAIIAVLTSGTTVEVLEGPIEADGFTWWRVRGQATDGLVEGWCVGTYLVAAAGP